MRESEEESLKFVLKILVLIALSLLINFPVMWLWNWLMPYLFHLPALTYWQMYGLCFLINFLFQYSRTE